MRMPARLRRWRPTHAHIRAVVGGMSTLGLALAAHRPDLVVIATPFVAVAVWGTLTRPSSEPVPSSRLGLRSLREGESTYLHYRVTNTSGVHAVSAVIRDSPWLQIQPVRRAVTVHVDRAGDRPVDVSFGVRAVRWGDHRVGPGALAMTSSWGAFRYGTVPMQDERLLTLPAPVMFDNRAPSPHPQGLVGLNRSARPGEGSEFNTIRPFQVGDRLRRIHWPSSLRTGGLNVTATYADHDSQVLVIVDATNDIGRSDGVDGAESTLDTTIRAAAAVSEHYIRRGERVAMRIFGAGNPTVHSAGTGLAHLRRMLAALARTEPGGTYEKQQLNPRYRIDPGTLVIMMSPLVSSVTLRRALALARHGLSLVVVDTMPTTVTHDSDEAGAVTLAWRIRMLERRVEISQVTSAGIPVVDWRGPGSLDQVLRDVGRRAAAPRLARR